MGMTTVAEVSMSSPIPGEYPIVLAPHHHNLYELGYPKAKSQRFVLRITPCPLNGRLLSMFWRRLRQGVRMSGLCERRARVLSISLEMHLAKSQTCAFKRKILFPPIPPSFEITCQVPCSPCVGGERDGSRW